MSVPFTGGCACGAIRYECSAAPVAMLNCHCRDCQYASGTSHSAVVAIPAKTINITGDTLKYYESTADSGTKVYRGFCSECGTPLFAKNAVHPEFMAVKPATLDDPGWFSPNIDIWTDSAQPWVVMNPDSLKFPKEMQ